jgi:hypothetical protein
VQISGVSVTFELFAAKREGVVADPDLQRIIDDLRKQRELLQRLDDPSLSHEQRKALRDAVERIRDGYRGKNPN